MTPIPAEAFGVNRKDAEWVDRMCVKHPLVCFEQKISLTGAHARVSKHTYVLATDYPLKGTFAAVADRLRLHQKWKVVDFPCGHDLMLDMPKETADLLIASA
ncbi:MAG: hypothetical protein QOK03_1345 [Candidatus Binataceae bacterium]|nr:hypothetical protein [Candidatus Binataceae bacterium]